MFNLTPLTPIVKCESKYFDVGLILHHFLLYMFMTALQDIVDIRDIFPQKRGEDCGEPECTKGT
jgi:hypothetical protein